VHPYKARRLGKGGALCFCGLGAERQSELGPLQAAAKRAEVQEALDLKPSQCNANGLLNGGPVANG
jgi:hypothetical protein